MKRALFSAACLVLAAVLAYLIGAFITWAWWWPPKVSAEARATIAVPIGFLAFWMAVYFWVFEKKE